MKYLANHTVEHTLGTVTPPTPIAQIGPGEAGLSQFLTTLITLIYAASTIVFVFMFVWGAFEWILSGGNKEGIAAARKRITTAIIGLTILSLSFVIIAMIGFITGFELFEGQNTLSNIWKEQNRQYHNERIDAIYPSPYVGPGATHKPGNDF